MADDHEDAINEFRQRLGKYTVKAACGREYVLVSRLAAWLESKVMVRGYEHTQMYRLLEYAYKGRKQAAIPISTGELRHDGGCLMVFCVLLEMGSGQFVHTLFRHEQLDSHLPISVDRLNSIFKNHQECRMHKEKCTRLAQEFDSLQWKFCPAKLDFRIPRTYPRQRIMPFIRKKEINKKGGTAQLFQIEVLGEFMGASLRKAVEKSEYDPKDYPNNSNVLYPDLGPRYELVVKTFEEGNIQLFQNELDAFKMLLNVVNENKIIRYLGDFGHSVPSISSQSTAQEATYIATHNIILEYGESDLEEYIATTSPPYLQEEIEGFWEGLMDVAVAVRAIHDLQLHESDQRYHGWHADIKPDNIIVVQKKFKLADPGFAKFIKWTKITPRENLSGGTETYGAPEWYAAFRTRGKVTQAIDIWSLGCVLSIAATWVILGHQAVLVYNELRRSALAELVESEKSLKEKTINQGDYFHDGTKVLGAVTEWHKVLRNSVRPTDKATLKILDLVDKEMLLQDASKRIHATEACRRLEAVINEARLEARIPVSAMITQMLQQLDNHATSPHDRNSVCPPGSLFHGASSKDSSGPKTIAQERKSRFLTPILKTAHRSLVLLPLQNTMNDGFESKITNNGDTLFDPQASRQMPRLETHQTPPRGPDTLPRRLTSSHSQRNSDASLFSGLTIPNRPGGPMRYKSNNPRDTRQDVFQARQQIEQREEGNWRGSKRLDEKLSLHFRDRDIEFLVDNGDSMEPFWYEASYLLETLLLKARGQDKNGLDLSFTTVGKVVKGKEKGTSILSSIRKDPFREAMKKHEPKPNAKVQCKTDLRPVLGEILHRYYRYAEGLVRLSQTNMKALTVIIFTDGAWLGMKNKDDVRTKIVSSVGKLMKLIGDLKERPLSIQFVQFGDDPDATDRLWRLDNLLIHEGIPDIVDHERMYTLGDINKMLLGSFVEDYDDDENDEPIPSSPYSALENQETFRPMVPGSRVSTLPSYLMADHPRASTIYEEPSQMDLESHHSRQAIPEVALRSATLDLEQPRRR